MSDRPQPASSRPFHVIFLECRRDAIAGAFSNYIRNFTNCQFYHLSRCWALAPARGAKAQHRKMCDRPIDSESELRSSM
ncbi:hypothetical protein [Lyngbya sp. CCY1209]|uniref:hypothetical protein n=1 Tax=Lyngbya sp. CCY1209 TaxID=2886103 RepID=UPI002D2057D3|nr:hypothetical protein [Lyngbya sp. CCY1209]MEB3886599.1 hypothetical protein [Lyngbya sp. CCY1209]